jgi:hypothetical protein
MNDKFHFCALCMQRKEINGVIVGCMLQPALIEDWIVSCPGLKAEPDPESLTCFECPDREVCDLVDDPYNTEGDCIMNK